MDPSVTTAPVNTAKPLITLALDHLSLVLTVSPWVILVVVVILVLVIIYFRYKGFHHGKDFTIDKAEMGLGNGKIVFKPNLKDQQIAYAVWVELSTRKIGLPINLDDDVISEIYESWYNFFSITRELIKDIPVDKVKRKSTQKIIRLSIDVLNEGLRPHLTLWQARFRLWYDKKLEKAEGDIDPQSIQSEYPRFEDLKKDLLKVNAQLMKYREAMKEIVLGVSTDEISEDILGGDEPPVVEK